MRSPRQLLTSQKRKKNSAIGAAKPSPSDTFTSPTFLNFSGDRRSKEKGLRQGVSTCTLLSNPNTVHPKKYLRNNSPGPKNRIRITRITEKNGQILNFFEEICPKGIFFETFWASSSGGFERPQTFFGKNHLFFHLYLSSVSLSFSLLSSVFFFILSLLFSFIFSLFFILSLVLSCFSLLFSCLLSLVSCL